VIKRKAKVALKPPHFTRTPNLKWAQKQFGVYLVVNLSMSGLLTKGKQGGLRADSNVLVLIFGFSKGYL
jgi:hypothetical protein